MRLRVLVAASFSLVVAACSSPGRWGHARMYAPTSEETNAAAGARDLDVFAATHKPEAWHGAKVQFFMVVEERKPGPGGAAYLTGKTRVLNDVNGCQSKLDEETCRVTVKPTGHDLVHVMARVREDDDVGEVRVSPGTLVRVVGTLSEQTDPDDGAIVVQASWYRQWPLGYYSNLGDLAQ